MGRYKPDQRWPEARVEWSHRLVRHVCGGCGRELAWQPSMKASNADWHAHLAERHQWRGHGVDRTFQKAAPAPVDQPRLL